MHARGVRFQQSNTSVSRLIPYSHTILDTYHLLTDLLVRPAQPHHDGYLHVQVTESQDDALSDHIAASQAAEDIDKDGLDTRIRADNPERRLDSL